MEELLKKIANETDYKKQTSLLKKLNILRKKENVKKLKPKEKKEKKEIFKFPTKLKKSMISDRIKFMQDYMKDHELLNDESKTKMRRFIDDMKKNVSIPFDLRKLNSIDRKLRPLAKITIKRKEKKIQEKTEKKKKMQNLMKLTTVAKYVNNEQLSDRKFTSEVREKLIRDINKMKSGKAIVLTRIELFDSISGEFIKYTNSNVIKTINSKSNNRKIVNILLHDTHTKSRNTMEDFEKNRDSGFTYKSLIGFDLNIAIHNGFSGASYIELPDKIKQKHSLLNVKNDDKFCFKWSSLAVMFSDKLKTKEEKLNPKSYEKYEKELNFENIEFPVQINDRSLKKIEKQNPKIGWLILGYNRKDNFYQLYRTKPTEQTETYIDLLFIENGKKQHYVAITNISGLFPNKHKGKRILCRNCMNWCTKDSYENHIKTCFMHESQIVEMPTDKNKFKKFSHKKALEKFPYVIYADFESFLEKYDDKDKTETLEKQIIHKPASAFYKIVSEDGNENKDSEIYRGEFSVFNFLTSLRIDALRLSKNLQKKKDIKDMVITPKQKKEHEKCKKCMYCGGDFMINKKVRHHDHLTGKYIGALCENCNLQINNHFIEIPVFFHNLKGYDSHHIMKEICEVLEEKDRIDIISENYEKYKSISWTISKNTKIVFKDSFQFLATSLSKLVSNLKEKTTDIEELKKKFPNLLETFPFLKKNEEKFNLLTQKGIFPYSWFSCDQKFKVKKLPKIEEFYDELNKVKCEISDYERANLIWSDFNCKSFKHYHDLYLKTDVCLLADIFENFRNIAFENYGLDVVHFITLPSYADSALYKFYGGEIELITDEDMLLMIESGIRGGVSTISGRYSQANNFTLPTHQEAEMMRFTTGIDVINYDEDEEKKWLLYIDANNLYGYGLSSKLPIGDYQWEKTKKMTDDFIMSYSQENERGYILEVDLDYPKEIHDLHTDYPLAVEKIKIDRYSKHVKSFIQNEPKPCEKLTGTLQDKKNYVVYIENLQFYMKHGLKLKKIHRVMSYHHEAWMEPYISFNTTQRQKAKNSFEKDFFKLMNNAVYGKTLQNRRKFEDMRVLLEEEDEEKLRKKICRITNNPNYEGFKKVSDKMLIFKSKKKKVKMIDPICCGFIVLEHAKMTMAKFHYDVFLPYYGKDKVKLLFTDTDSFCYEIQTEDVWEDLKDKKLNEFFDFSNLPEEHPLFDKKNKAVIGKMKIETSDKTMTRFVGLRSKMYSYEVLGENPDDKCGIVKKAKGVKKMVVSQKFFLDDYINIVKGKRKGKHAEMCAFRSINHQIYSIKQKKLGLSGYDDKRFICRNGIDTLPWGHYSIKEKDIVKM